MNSNEYSFNAVWDAIADIAVKTLMSAQPHIAQSYKSIFNVDPAEMSCCFELLGMDVMLDKHMKPWLVELNSSPSFSVETPEDLQIKEAMIADTLRMVETSWKLIYRLRREEKQQVMSRLLSWQHNQNGSSNSSQTGSTASVPSSSATTTEDDYKHSAHAKQLASEEARKGNFVRIYPSDVEERSERLNNCLRVAHCTEQETRIGSSNPPLQPTNAGASTTTASATAAVSSSASSSNTCNNTNRKHDTANASSANASAHTHKETKGQQAASEKAAEAEEEVGRRKVAGPPKLSTAERIEARESVLKLQQEHQRSLAMEEELRQQHEHCKLVEQLRNNTDRDAGLPCIMQLEHNASPLHSSAAEQQDEAKHQHSRPQSLQHKNKATFAMLDFSDAQRTPANANLKPYRRHSQRSKGTHLGMKRPSSAQAASSSAVRHLGSPHLSAVAAAAAPVMNDGSPSAPLKIRSLNS